MNDSKRDQEQSQSGPAPEPVVEASESRIFSIKALLFGILGLLFTIGFTAINDIYLKQTSFVANHLPPGPIFLVIALALIWNPMWSKRSVLWVVGSILFILAGTHAVLVLQHSFWLSWHLILLPLFACCSSKFIWNRYANKLTLSGRELIAALIIILVGCWTPGAGLNYFFAPTQISSWTIYNNNVQMQKTEAIHYVPQHLWPAGGLKQIGNNQQEKQRVYDAFHTGYKEQGTDGVPWDAWIPPVLSSWGPLFILFSICLISLSLIVHRQWSQHEQLAYPIAEIGGTLFQKTSQHILPTLFYDRKFWIASCLVICFHGVRYIHAWWPNNSPDIPTATYFNFILDLFPTLTKSGLFSVHAFNFFFSIIGICYFLSREIGLTIGIAPFLLALFSAQVYMATGTGVSGDDTASMRAGSYLAYAAIILFTGRRYYWRVLKKAITFKAADEHEQDGILAARVLIAAFTGLIIVLTCSFNLELPLAILFSLTGMLMFLVFTRIICETGIPYLQSAWDPGVILIKVLGVNAVGATPLVLLYYVSTMLFSDPKEALMPYVANSLKMADDNKFKLKRLFIAIIAVVGVAVFISIGTRLYQQYSMGGHALNYPWADRNVPQIFLSNATRDLTALDDIGQRSAPGEAHQFGLLERIGMIDPNSRSLSYILVGICGVSLFFFLRFRFLKFPLHPVLFLIWGITPNARTFYSFLIGWAIREAIVRFGGGKVYQDMKPFFIGLIFAELLMGILGVSVGLLYHVFTNFEEHAPRFRVILG